MPATTPLGDQMAREALELYDSLTSFRDEAVRQLPSWEGHCTELVFRLVLAMPSLTRLRHCARDWMKG